MKSQTYQNWKWALVCTAAEKEKLLERIRGQIPEQKICLIPAEGHEGYQQRIAQGMHEILTRKHQQADWITLLAPSDTLEPDALYSCVKLMEQRPQMDLCYTDEDQIAEDGKTYREPVFKSDFNIDLLRAVNYLGHLVLVREDVAQKAGPWNPRYQADADL